MKSHISAGIYDTFYVMKDISYRLNNPLDTKSAPAFEINIRRFVRNSRISRNGRAKFLIL